MLDWAFNRSIFQRLGATKRIKLFGVTFIIKKIDSISYLSGINGLVKNFSTYDEKKMDQQAQTMDEKRIKDHYRSVLMSGVIFPELSLKKDDPGKLFVDTLFKDNELLDALYSEIVSFTYGKKKIK